MFLNQHSIPPGVDKISSVSMNLLQWSQILWSLICCPDKEAIHFINRQPLLRIGPWRREMIAEFFFSWREASLRLAAMFDFEGVGLLVFFWRSSSLSLFTSIERKALMSDKMHNISFSPSILMSWWSLRMKIFVSYPKKGHPNGCGRMWSLFERILKKICWQRITCGPHYVLFSIFL